MKIATALQGYMLDKRLDFNPNTVASYTRVFRRYFDYVGDGDLEAVTPDDVRRFLTQLRIDLGLSPRGEPVVDSCPMPGVTKHPARR